MSSFGSSISECIGGSSCIPPAEAAEKIENSVLLIAICTRRDELSSKKLVMPQAVQDEISIAFGKGVPILMFIEDGVEASGLKNNYGTWEPFDRDNILSSIFIGKAINAIHSSKLRALGDGGFATQTGMDDAIAEFVNHLVELRPDDNDYCWSYSTQKRITYTQTSRKGFPTGVWAAVKAQNFGNCAPLEWEHKLISSSNDIKLIPEVERRTHDSIEVILKPEPHPIAGDFIEFSTHSSSRCINAVWSDDIGDQVFVRIEDQKFECADGLVFMHRTKFANIEFRFPASYGLNVNEIYPFVGAYATKVEYLVPSELERAKVEKKDFAGNVTVSLAINSPLPGHFYGVAWHPKVKQA